MKQLFEYLPGLVLCIVIAFAAKITARFIPLGAVTIAIILGIIAGNLKLSRESHSSGINFSEKIVLSAAIALLGLELNFQILGQLGYRALILISSALFFTIFTALTLSKIFKFDKKFVLLLGIGNGICGSSAIAATEKIIGVKEEAVGLSIAIVNFLGVIGMFILPVAAVKLLHFSDINSGLFIGNILQAVGQVIAAAFSISETVGQTATVVKMTRILLLFPVVLILLFIYSDQNKSENKNNKKKIEFPKIPGFIIGFILFSLIPTFKLLPENIIKIMVDMSSYFLVTAMAAIGLKISFASILRDGRAALLIGGLIFIVQIIFSSVGVLIFSN